MFSIVATAATAIAVCCAVAEGMGVAVGSGISVSDPFFNPVIGRKVGTSLATLVGFSIIGKPFRFRYINGFAPFLFKSQQVEIVNFPQCFIQYHSF